MTVYLHDIPLQDALNKLDEALETAGLSGILGEEEVQLDEYALSRVLSRPIWARISSPHYHAAAMDGFAVSAGETNGASLTNPVVLEEASKAYYVDTGDMLPKGFDSVIPIENVEALDKNGEIASDVRKPAAIRIRGAITPWQHVRPMGEDMVATQLVLPSGHKLRPVDLGAIAGCGHTTVFVSRRPKVAILPTGSELVNIGDEIKPGDIIEYNSLVLAAQINGWGGESTRFPITPDDLGQIEEVVSKASKEYDLVLLNAGSSAGAEDFSAQVVEKLGKLLVHGVAVRPGHPVILGMIKHPESGEIPIIGVPGYPVSAALTGEIFIEPLMARWLGRPAYQPDIITAELTRKVNSPGGDDDFMRVAVGRVGRKILAAPLTRGAGVISSLVRADGLALIPRGSQGEPAGAKVDVRLYRQRAELDKAIFSIGSHDLTLDIIAQYLSKYDRRLISANVGSVGGLVALQRGEAHLAGSHLLDPDSGEYNRSYLNQYLPEKAVNLVGLVDRQQGLIVRHNNPKRIVDLRDLIRTDVLYVNRQRGAGTRVLLDYHLGLLGIDSEAIQGYNQEEYTHLGVAAAIASERADTGLGIAAAAAALDLDFIPLYEEEYDLVIPLEFYNSPLLEPLFTVLNSHELAEAIKKLPGYGTKNIGKVMAEHHAQKIV
jgi:putative molybdopterin biosynthesis protein